jgi:hypothetical protein
VTPHAHLGDFVLLPTIWGKSAESAITEVITRTYNPRPSRLATDPEVGWGGDSGLPMRTAKDSSSLPTSIWVIGQIDHGLEQLKLSLGWRPYAGRARAITHTTWDWECVTIHR